MFIAAPFPIARTWKQSRCPSMDKWLRKLWHIYTMEYYSAIKRNEFEAVLVRWMNLKYAIQNEVNQKEKNNYINTYITESRKMVLMNLFVGQEQRCRHREQTFVHSNRRSESEVAQSCLTLCDPMDCSLPCSSVRGILEARILEWVAISFSRRSSQHRDWTRVSRIAGRCFTIWATREVAEGEGGTNWESSIETYTLPLLLLLSHFSRVRPCATPQTTAHQAPPSLGFSRQEHWSGLPFPSPVHESEKWK